MRSICAGGEVGPYNLNQEITEESKEHEAAHAYTVPEGTSRRNLSEDVTWFREIERSNPIPTKFSVGGTLSYLPKPRHRGQPKADVVCYGALLRHYASGTRYQVLVRPGGGALRVANCSDLKSNETAAAAEINIAALDSAVDDWFRQEQVKMHRLVSRKVSNVILTCLTHCICDRKDSSQWSKERSSRCQDTTSSHCRNREESSEGNRRRRRKGECLSCADWVHCCLAVVSIPCSMLRRLMCLDGPQSSHKRKTKSRDESIQSETEEKQPPTKRRCKADKHSNNAAGNGDKMVNAAFAMDALHTLSHTAISMSANLAGLTGVAIDRASSKSFCEKYTPPNIASSVLFAHRILIRSFVIFLC